MVRKSSSKPVTRGLHDINFDLYEINMGTIRLHWKQVRSFTLHLPLSAIVEMVVKFDPYLAVFRRYKCSLFPLS